MPIYETCTGTVELTQEQANFIYKQVGYDCIEDAIYAFSILLAEEYIDPEEMSFYINKLMKRK